MSGTTDVMSSLIQYHDAKTSCAAYRSQLTRRLHNVDRACRDVALGLEQASKSSFGDLLTKLSNAHMKYESAVKALVLMEPYEEQRRAHKAALEQAKLEVADAKLAIAATLRRPKLQNAQATPATLPSPLAQATLTTRPEASSHQPENLPPCSSNVTDWWLPAPGKKPMKGP